MVKRCARKLLAETPDSNGMRLSPARRFERVSRAKVAKRSDSGIAIAIAAKTSTAAQWPNTRGDYSTGQTRVTISPGKAPKTA